MPPAGYLADPFFDTVATFAAFEVDLLRMRTREGMGIARAEGNRKGRALKLSKTRQTQLPELHAAGAHRGRGAATRGVSGPRTRCGHQFERGRVSRPGTMIQW